MNRKPSGHSRHTDKICECFEQRDLSAEKDEQVKSALEWLSFISERLNELVHIFTEIEEENITVTKAGCKKFCAMT